MIWKKFPHRAPEGSKIFVYYKVHGNPYREDWGDMMLPLTVAPNQMWAHIHKWCFQDELIEENERLLKEKMTKEAIKQREISLG